jgi:hypothetical protein
MQLLCTFFKNPNDIVYVLSNNIFLRLLYHKPYVMEWHSDIDPEFNDLFIKEYYEPLHSQPISFQEEINCFLSENNIT